MCLGHRLLLSTRFSPTPTHDVTMYITTPPPLPHSNSIRQSGFRFRFRFDIFSYGLRSFLVILDLEFLFSNHVLYIHLLFSPTHTHIHLRINPCILSSYPHHAYYTLSLRFRY
jgi:hypothetical protein